MSEYPDYFPKECPPADAVFEECQSYRLCANNPITRSDFCSYYELGKSFRDCKGYGASLFTDLKAISVIAKMPLHKADLIAEGITSHLCGPICKANSSNGGFHITWWLFKDAAPEEYYRIKE